MAQGGDPGFFHFLGGSVPVVNGKRGVAVEALVALSIRAEGTGQKLQDKRKNLQQDKDGRPGQGEGGLKKDEKQKGKSRPCQPAQMRP